jgi:hypothetical protein
MKLLPGYAVLNVWLPHSSVSGEPLSTTLWSLFLGPQVWLEVVSLVSLSAAFVSPDSVVTLFTSCA